MKARLGALAALTAIAAFAAPQTASAATCTHQASAYDKGGSPRSGSPNDPLFGHQWGLTQIHAPAAWSHGARGKGVHIAIVDTGVDYSHPDLKAKLLTGPDFVKTSDGLSGPGCPGAQDENGHGTHVAGIAAASTGNGIGVAGTAPAAKILPVRVLDKGGNGVDTAVDRGIRWAADHGARVINLSLGGSGTSVLGLAGGGSSSTDAAVSYAYSKGAVVVAAAGNESSPLCDYPAAAKHAVCVAATDQDGMPAFYSNFPVSPGGTVALRAPGGASGVLCEDDADIWSTILAGSSDDCTGPTGIKGYDTLAGTSMATPFVSGVAALLAGRGLSASQILQCLKTKSSNHGSYDEVNGYGIVDAGAAVAGCGKGTTPPFKGGTGGGTGGGKRHHVSVQVKRTSRRQLGHRGRLVVYVTSDRKATVKLRANVRRGKRTTTGARRTVRLKHAGKRRTVLKLNRKARARVRRKGRVSVRVRYRAGRESGVAATRR